MHLLKVVGARCFSVLAVAALLTTTIVAQDSRQAEPALPSPGDLHTRVSRVYTFVEKTGLGHQHAIEGKLVSGNLILGAKSSAGQMVFDMTSFDADTPSARKYIGLPGSTEKSTRSKVTANMKGADVLNVRKYPTATFDITSALATGKTSNRDLPTYHLKGKFTLHGVTKPLSVVVEVEQERGWLHVRGNFVVKQTSFGITPFSKAFGAIGVADALRIYGDVWVAPHPDVAMNTIPKRK